MTGTRTALVTAGTGGVGAAVAEELARRGFEILVTGRGVARGRTAESALRAAGAPAAHFLATDHSEVGGVPDLVDRVRRHTDALDVVVANAGSMPLRPCRTTEGLPHEVAVEVVGTVALVDDLLPFLIAARHPRAVFVTSDAATHFGAPWDEDPWADQSPGAAGRAYGRAKTWKMLCAAALAEQWEGRVAVLAANPGPAWTPMTKAMTRQALGVSLPVWGVIRAVQRASSPSRAGRCVVRGAVGPLPRAGSGSLLRGRRRAAPVPFGAEVARAALAEARHLRDVARAAGTGSR